MNKLKWNDLSRDNNWLHLGFISAGTISGKMHCHDFCEIFITADNGLIHCINGLQHDLPANTLVLIRPQDTHYFKSTRQAVPDKEIFMNLAFPSEIVDEMRNRLFFDDHDFWGGTNMQPASFILMEDERRRLWNDALKLMQGKRTRFELECFLLNMLQTTGSGKTGNEINAPAWLQQACVKIKEPQNMRKGLERFYLLCGKCREHISRQLKKSCGISPVDFIARLRIEYAARLLSDTSMQLHEIAAECGFENLNYFFTAFKKHYATTPRKYRLRTRGGNRIV
jgi:AraC family cel operon transcriptional repressor